MRKFLLFLLFLFSYLSAEQITPYLTSENDALSLVDGIVNAYNGKLVQIDKDIEIQGSEPLELIRYYDGGHHFDSEFGYGVGLSIPTLLTFDPYSKKQNVRVEQRVGSEILFTVIKQKDKKQKRYLGKVDPEYVKNGYTNCCEALLRGKPSIFSMQVEGTDDQFVLTIGDGTRRYYRYYYRDELGYRYYRMTLEELPSGNLRHYSYINEESIHSSRIWTTNKDNSLTLNWIQFTYYDDHVITEASNGQKVRYGHVLRRGKAVQSDRNGTATIKFSKMLLSEVAGAHLPKTEYEAISRSHFSGSLFSVKKIRKPDGLTLEVDYNGAERVKQLFASGSDSPLYTFDYHKGCTIVTDALGRTQRYYFDSRRLVKLVESHRIQKYLWNKRGELLSHTITDPSGKLISKRAYQYDTRGNIIETTVTGTITGNGSEDSYVVRYAYDAQNHLLSENYNGRKEIRYTYCPGTNLVERKLTFAEQLLVEREFYDYDRNGILIRKTIDDGSCPNRDDLTHVTYQRISEIEPQLDPSLPGMTLPQLVQEWHVDLQTGQRHLLKMVRRTYTQGDLLAEEKVYDNHAQHQYNLFYEYNERRELIRQTDPLGTEMIYRYDDNGNKVYEERIGSGKKLIYCYDTANRLTQVREEHENGAVFLTSHTYDAMGNETSTTDRFGQKTTFQYDSAGREICQTDPLGRSLHKEYDAEGHVTKWIDQDGNITTATHNLYGELLEAHHTDGTSKRYAYNPEGHLLQEWERDGTYTTYEVDYQGRPLAAKTYALNGIHLKTIRKTYKGPNLISEVDPMGNETTYLYDTAGRKTAMIQGEKWTRYEFDNFGRPAKTLSSESVEIQVFDFLDRVVEERTEDHAGNIFQKAQYAYDSNGNCVSEKIFSDFNDYSETRTIYNAEHQPILRIDPLGNQTTFAYHYSDHLEKEVIDPLGRRKLEIYDPLHRLQAVRQYSSNGQLLSDSTFAFDGRGNQVLQEEKNLFQGQCLGFYAIRTSYDAMGRKISETEQDHRATSYTYLNSRLHTIKKPDGVVLTHTYDLLGRLQELVSSDGTIHFRYAYDLNDQLLQAEDLINNTTTQRSYDFCNRLISEKQVTGFEVYYEYDALNRLKEISFLGDKIAYSYSPTSLVSASRYKDNQLLYTYTQQLDWRGKVLCATLPNGTEISYIWDSLGRCACIESPLFFQSFAYDAVGNLVETSVSDLLGSYSSTFACDALNQLTQETGPFANQYAFDSLNNRKDKNGATCSVDPLNQLLNDSADLYSYDKNGRRSSKSDAQYSYDAMGRLISFGDAHNRITYQYDPFGRRIERRDPHATVQYFYQFDTEIGSSENGNRKEFRAIHGQHAPFAIELNNEVYSPLRNHRGDICVLLDSEKIAVSTYRYDSFGEFIQQGAIASPWLFSGQRYDDATQLYHFAKREYDPCLGRWLTPDPLGFADGPNLYAYVQNNPLIYIDPYGLWREQVHYWADRTKSFSHSFCRGFIDDTTFGATSFMLGDHQGCKTAYYMGTASSMVVGLAYGGTWAKGVKGVFSAFRYAKPVITATQTTKNALQAKNIVKLAQESKPAVQKIAQSAKITGNEVAKEGVNVGKQIWSINRENTSVENALYHWNKHGKEFPDLQNAKQYVEKAWSISKSPQNEILLKARPNGEMLRYHRETNTFGSYTKDGIPKTMFCPKKGIEYWESQ